MLPLRLELPRIGAAASEVAHGNIPSWSLCQSALSTFMKIGSNLGTLKVL